MNIEELMEELFPLIKEIASYFYHVPFEDLLQAGRLGVLKAYRKYRQNGTVKFSTYAYDYIFGEMYEFTRKNQEIKVSKDLMRLAKKIEIAKNTLALKMGRIPTYGEIGEFLNLSLFQIMEASNIKSQVLSLDESSDESRDLYETIPSDSHLSLEDKLNLETGIERLPKEEQKIIRYRYFKDLSQMETAKRMGLSQVTVSRYENKSLKRLKQYYDVF